MLKLYRNWREKREQAAQLKAFAEATGDHFRAELNLFVELQVVPPRKAFLDVFRGELEKLDERIAEFADTDQISRLEAAGHDYRLLMENWSKRDPERLANAREWLSEQYELAETMGIQGEFHGFVEQALADQKLRLMSDGLEVMLELVPECRADYDNAPHP